jgi:hypothetical protein
MSPFCGGASRLSVDWALIDASMFEDMVVELANKVFAEEQWRATPKSRDGNKDAVAMRSVSILKQKMIEEYWAEAKYTSAQKVRKTIFDSTLVSALINGKVRGLLFATNGEISRVVMLRMQTLFCPEGSLRRIVFADGNILSKWIFSNPYIHEKYFLTKIAKQLTRSSFEIGPTSIHRLSLLQRDYLGEVKRPKVGNRYAFSILVRSDEPVRLKVIFPNDMVVRFGIMQTDAAMVFDVVGSFLITLPFAPTTEGERLTFQAVLRDENGNVQTAILSDISIERNRDVKVLHRSQAATFQRIFEIMKAFSTRPHPGIVSILASGGVGKSYLLEKVFEEHCLIFPTHFVSFTNQPAHDAKAICALIWFLNFRSTVKAGSTDKSILRSYPHYSSAVPLADIAEGACDSVKALDVVERLKAFSLGSLFPETNAGTPPCLVLLDDFHKPSEPASAVLRYIIERLAIGKMPALCLTTVRPNEFSDERLSEVLATHTSFTLSISPPDVNDVMLSLAENFPDLPTAELANWIAPIADSTLVLERILLSLDSTIGTRRSPMSFEEILADLEKSAKNWPEKDFLHRKRQTPLLSAAVELIYLLPNGVPRNFVIEQLGKAVESQLVNYHLVRTSSERSRTILKPYHDLYVAMNTGTGDILTENAFALFDAYLDTIPAGEHQLLAPLLRKDEVCLRRYFLKGISYCQRMIGNTQFGMAYPIAEALYFGHVHRSSSIDFPSDVSTLHLKYWYADCLNHCRSGNDAVKIFDEIFAESAGTGVPVADVALGMKARAEVLSIRYWNLDVGTLLDDLCRFLEQTGARLATRKSLRDNPDFVQAVVGAHNRLMMVYFLLDQEKEGEQAWLMAQQDIERLEGTITQGGIDVAILRMDYARALYLRDPAKALAQMHATIEVFAATPIAGRRHLLAQVDAAFLSAMTGDTGIEPIEEIANQLLERRFFEEHSKCFLKIGAVAARLGDLDLAASCGDRLQSSRLSESCQRTEALYANLMGAVTAMLKNMAKSSAYVKQHAKLVQNLGESYRRVADHNGRVKTPKRIVWSSEPDWSDAYVLESRVW